jgi:hypothetical protein
MIHVTPRLEDQGSHWRGAAAGAVGGAVAAIAPMVVFYPLGRLFDPSVGGTPRGTLASEVVLGFIGGVMISPIGAGFGALVGNRLRLRPLRSNDVLALLLLPVAIGVAMFVALNGGLIDERGSTDALQHVLALSLLAWFVGIVGYSVARLFFVRAGSDEFSVAT